MRGANANGAGALAPALGQSWHCESWRTYWRRRPSGIPSSGGHFRYLRQRRGDGRHGKNGDGRPPQALEGSYGVSAGLGAVGGETLEGVALAGVAPHAVADPGASGRQCQLLVGGKEARVAGEAAFARHRERRHQMRRVGGIDLAEDGAHANAKGRKAGRVGTQGLRDRAFGRAGDQQIAAAGDVNCMHRARVEIIADEGAQLRNFLGNGQAME